VATERGDEEEVEGHIRKRGKRSWSIVVERGRGPDGRRLQSWHTVRGTRRDAERERARLLHELNTGAYVEPAKLTVAQYLDQWLRDYAEPRVAAKTFERYEEIIERHLVPALGHHRLDKLQPLHIQAYYSSALRGGRLDGKGGLSAQTVLHHHRLLRQALHQAVRWQLLMRNPADAVEPPRPRRREMQALDDDQVARLLEAAKMTNNYIPVLIAVTTGLRRGEVLALRWQDVDLDKGTLAVRQTLQQTKAGLAFKEPKSQKSRRVVALPPILVEELRKHRTAQGKQRLTLGPAYQDHDLVCPQDDGAPRSPNALSCAFRDLVSRVEVPRVRLHDQRHTHATQLLKHGVHPKVVSERLGHANIGITLDVYSHVLPGMQEDAARRVDAALRSALNRKK
jgi:integrase